MITTMPRRRNDIAGLLLAGTILVSGCAGGPLTTREKGAGIGALGGAAVGGLIGSAVGHPAAGAAIGGGLGLGAGALVGDQLQGQEQHNYRQDEEFAVIRPRSIGSDTSWRGYGGSAGSIRIALLI
jgi:phage tail tape-measure protein